MNTLRDGKKNALSFALNNVSPISYDENLIIRKSLSGKPHIQTIGKSMKRISATVFTEKMKAEIINEMQMKGEHLFLTVEGKEYECILEKAPIWKIETKGREALFSAQLSFIVS